MPPVKLNLHLLGGRFDQMNGIPVSSFPAIRAVSQLISSLARDWYLQHHRVPKVPPGFVEAVEPLVTRIEDGGSMNADLLFYCPEDVKVDVVAAYSASSDEAFSMLRSLHGGELEAADWVGARSVASLEELLHLVEDGEALEVNFLDSEGRALRRVEPLSSSAREIAARGYFLRFEVGLWPFQLVGRVNGLTANPPELRLLLQEGSRQAVVAVEEAMLDVGKDVFNHPSLLVWIGGQVVRNTDGSIVKRLGRTIKVVGGPAVAPRLEHLADLSQGWSDDPDSRGPSKALCQRAARTIWSFVEKFAWDRPRVYPDEDGGIDLLWVLDAGELHLGLSADSHVLAGMYVPNDGSGVFHKDGSAAEIQAWLATFVEVPK